MSGASGVGNGTASAGRLRFDRFVLDIDDERLRDGDRQLRLGQKAFRVLVALTRAGGRLVTKEVLLGTVWADVHVSESALTSAIKELRRALGDDARTPRFIDSVYGRGYRFLPAVEALSAPATPLPQPPVAAPGAPLQRPLTILAASIDVSDPEADPGDMVETLSGLITQAVSIIAAHGGTLARPPGQALLALFGWPNADEDAAANAVRAGVALTAITARGDARVSAGIATGTVVISPAPLPGAPPSLVGEAVVQAERMAATGPAVLVNDATRRAAEWVALFEPAPPLHGATGPVPAFAVADIVRFASRSHASGAAGPLFGRDVELALLRRCWDSAAEGVGQVAVITGEAGIGKSRLAGALVDGVPPQQVIAWYGRAGADGQPFQPVADWVAREAGLEPAAPAEARRARLTAWLGTMNQATAAPALAELLGIAPGGATEGLRDRLLGLLVPLIERRASSPLLLLVEDLHWLDPSSRDLLDRLVARTPELPLLVVATTRPGGRQDWSDAADVVAQTLGPLPSEAAVRIVTAIDAQGQVSPETLQAIVRRGEGVPLFIEELAKSVVESGDDGGATLAAVPATLQEVVAARLDRLGPARDVAQIAAVAGRRFSYELVARVAGLPAPALRQALRELVRAGLVLVTGVPPASQYAFAHALIQDAVYDQLPRRQRERLHAGVAAALRDTGSADADPGLLAFHLARGGDAAAAVPLWVRAGQAAAAKAAHLEAVAQFGAARKALDTLPAAAPAERLEVLLGLAVSLAAARGYSAPEVGAVLAEARVICDATGDAHGLFTVLRGMCAFATVLGDLEQAERLAADCRDIGRDTGVPQLRIEGECPYGYVLWARGRFAEARRHLETVVQLYDAHDGAAMPPCTPQDPLIQALGPLSQSCHALGDAAAAARWRQRLAVHGDSLGATFSQALSLYWQAILAIDAADFATAVRVAEAALQLCEAQAYDALIPYVRTMCGLARGLSGQDGRTAAEAAAEAMMDLERFGLAHGLAWNQGQLAALWLRLGAPDAALHWSGAALATAARALDDYCRAPLLHRHAEVLAAQLPPDWELVAATLDEAGAVADAQGARRLSADVAAVRQRLGVRPMVTELDKSA